MEFGDGNFDTTQHPIHTYTEINNGWSGINPTSNRLAPQGTYQFHAQFSLGDEDIYDFSGSVLLLK